MKAYTVCSVIVLLSAVTASLAATGLGKATVHESHPNQCYNEKAASYYSPGESWPMEGGCGKVTCEKMSSISSTKLMTSFVTCGKAMVGAPCYMSEEDLTKSYPDCCPQPVCPETPNNAFELPLSSSEENFASNEASFENDVAHFSLGGKNTKQVDHNNLEESQEDQDNTAAASTNQKPRKVYNENQRFEVRMPVELPPTFEYADVSEEMGSSKSGSSKTVYDENQSFELRLPKELPASFQYADIDGDHEDQRLNEVDSQDDFRWV